MVVEESKNNFLLKYFKIYFWQLIALVTNLGSMFIVLPFLTVNQDLYGIYAIVISLSIFFSYADIGFIYSAQKYAAEFFINNNKLGELKIIGFSIFLTSLVIIFISLILGIILNDPEIVIKGISSNYENFLISKKLFFLLIISAFITIPLKLCQLIFSIRLEEYVMQRINISANIIRLFSIIFLFSNGKYLIVEYFALIQLLNIIVVFICFYIINKKYSIKFKEIITFIKFDKVQFIKSKYLAFSGFYIMIIWILYYELDQIVIGKFLGSSDVAIYAIGFSLLSFIRGLFGILYSPFNHRFNYFTGLKDYDGLKNYYKTIVINLSPIIIGFIASFYLLMDNLVISWVGITFVNSIIIGKILILCNLFAFISYPTSMLLKSLVQLKKFNIFNSLMPIVFFSIIYFHFEETGLVIFAYSKFTVFFLLAIFYAIFYKNYIKESIIKIINNFFLSHLIPLLSIIAYSNFIKHFLPYSKSSINLLIILVAISTCILVYYFVFFLLNKSSRNYFFVRINYLLSSFK
ncbi:hypothetical protein OAQ20_01005 [Flavobacteriaceae bacterium]|nr:hypothetical protein [Flavobacteriaceae bacterium]